MKKAGPFVKRASGSVLEQHAGFGHMAGMVLPVDHLVLPVADLAVARSRYGALGFTVAPDGVHPFGTVNACVYFGGGTFLEPLAVGNAAAVEAAIGHENVFVARDRAFRAAHGAEGFSAVVLGTPDAAADDARYQKAEISAGPILNFQRPFTDADGMTDTASFRLAFAAETAAKETFFFACERMNVPEIDRSALERHDNGAVQLRSVVLAAAEPEAHCAFLEALSGAVAQDGTAGDLHIDTGNGAILVLTPGMALDRYGIAVEPDGLTPCGAVFGVADIAATEKLFNARAIDYEKRSTCLVVPKAAGQGTSFIFEAMP